MMRIIRVIDFETAGLAPPAGVCEVATVDVLVHDNGMIDRGETWSSLINPGQPIPPEASAIHHIVDGMVADAPAFDAEMMAHIGRGPPDAFCAHFTKFDRQWFNPPGAKWIDSYKVALHLWPDCPSHSNQCLRYFLKLCLLDVPEPHRAASDAYVTAAILRKAIMRLAGLIEEKLAWMVEVSGQPAVLTKFRFGKHQGVPIKDVPENYLSWVLGQPGIDEDARHTAATELKRRREIAT